MEIDNFENFGVKINMYMNQFFFFQSYLASAVHGQKGEKLNKKKGKVATLATFFE